MSDFANKLGPLYPIEYVCTVYAQIMYVLISSIDLKSKKKK